MKKPFENKTNSPMYVSGVMVPPGEMVLVDVPDDAPQGAPDAPHLTLAEQVFELLAGKVAAVTAALPGLSEDALAMAQALEEGAPKPRQTLLTALANERIARADAALALKSDPL